MLRLALIVLLMPASVCPVQPFMETHTIPLSEVSGAVNIGRDRVIVVADEGYEVQVVSNAAATFKNGDPEAFEANMAPAISGMKGGKNIVDDLEGVAWDETRQAAFLITSHSRSKKQDDVADPMADKPQRHKLARLIFESGNDEVSHQETDVLEGALKKFSFVSAAMKRPHQEGGNTGTLNIEGLAFDQKSGDLLIGLRSPTQNHLGKPCAVVLRLRNPHELFDGESVAPEFDPKPLYLDLAGQGIRCIIYDTGRKGLWIAAGRSADPDEPMDKVPPSLWFLDLAKSGKRPQRVKADFSGLNVESVCLLEREGKPGLLLISDDGDKDGSRYVWTPIPKLTK